MPGRRVNRRRRAPAFHYLPEGENGPAARRIPGAGPAAPLPRRPRYHAQVLRAILFDFNGVLVDDEPLHCRLIQRVLAEEGLALAEEEYFEEYAGLDDRGCFAALLARGGAAPDPTRVSRLAVRKSSYYREAIRRQGYPVPPAAVELVRAAADEGLMLGVVSGASRGEVREALLQAGLTASFKVTVTAEDVEAGKPDPEGYLRALDLLNSLPPLPERLLHPHEVLAIEDSRRGLAAAAAAGLVTLALSSGPGRARRGEADLRAPGMAALDLSRLRDAFPEPRDGRSS